MRKGAEYMSMNKEQEFEKRRLEQRRLEQRRHDMASVSIIIPLGCSQETDVNQSLPYRHAALLCALKNFYGKHDDIETIIVTQNYDFPDTPEASVIRLASPVFNKGWCINVGVQAAKNDMICIAESDMYGAEPYLNDVIKFMIQKNLLWCFGNDCTIFTTEIQRKAVMAGHTSGIGELDRRIPVPDGYEGGFLFFNRNFFLGLGGCNEWFEELGCIDNELVLRAQAVTGTYELYPVNAWHLWHPECKKHTRSLNLDLRIVTKHHPLLLNAFLSLQDFGKVETPCHVFETAWDRFIAEQCLKAKDLIQKSWERYQIEEEKRIIK